MHQHRAKLVVFSALSINLTLGVLYAWSIFKDAIVDSILSGAANGFHWQIASANDPYALCCLVFSFTMISAGKMQDKYGAVTTALLGAALGGFGFYLIANSTDYWVWLLGYGVFVGAGIGFGYSSTTPAALKWYAKSKSGLITGIVVSGFALASTYIAPLASHLVKTSGLHHAMLFFAAQFFIVIAFFSLFLSKPPADYVPIGFQERRQRANSQTRNTFSELDHEIEKPLHALKDKRFWLLWVLFFIGSGAGLMVIGNIKPLAKQSMGELAYLAIIILAVGDAVGRISSGYLCARLGSRNVLSSAFFLQTVFMFSAYTASVSGSPLFILLVATFIGINYGTNLVLFPNYVKDFWGMKHFGFIYGLLFSAWGVGGFTMIKLSQVLIHQTGNSKTSFMVAGSFILLGLLLTFFIDNRKDLERIALRKQRQAA